MSAGQIRTPDQRLRVFISSTLHELADERVAARTAVESLRLIPVMFELGARPHPPRNLYRAYLAQSDIFLGIYWQSYGWVAPGMDISGLEDEYLSSGDRPKLIYVKRPANDRDDALARMLADIQNADISYKPFTNSEQLRELVKDDLAILLTERFVSTEVAPAFVEEPAAKPLFELPTEISTLVGRQKEVEELAALLERDEVRLVTLSGPGGIGKTRLATEVARNISHRFRDGVRFVPLAAVRDDNLFSTTIAHALGFSEDEKRPSIELLKESLAAQELLIVLDNFEQILDAAPVLAELLAAGPGLKVMVTSRSLLRLRGEREFQVPPLELPGDSPADGSVDQYAAVRLFIERARLAKPDFEVNNDNAPAVAAICHRLDGLPLAIELAAARIKVLSPEALLDRLSDRFKILTGGYRDLPDRQRTLRDAIDWSYELLDESDRILFTRLSVFVGGRSLEAMEEVCNPDGVLDILSSVSSLTDKSLLRQVAEFAGEPRFRMLESLHEYAAERLEERGETERFRKLHMGYFRALVARAAEELRGEHQAQWFDRLALENDNLRAALRTARVDPDHRSLLDMVYGLWRFWVVRGYVREGSVWTEEAARVASNAEPRSAAKALYAAGEMAHARMDREQSESHWHRALQICIEAADKEGVATLQNVLGNLEFERGHTDVAADLYRSSLALFREIADPRGQAQVLNNLGHIASALEDWATSLQCLEQSLQLFDELNDQQGIARALLNIGVTHREAGNLRDAEYYVKEGTRLWHALHGLSDLTDCLEDWGALQTLLGKDAEAAHIFGAAEALREEISTPIWESEAEVLAPYWETLRERMGTDDYERALKEGRALTLEEAVQRIMEGGITAAPPS